MQRMSRRSIQFRILLTQNIEECEFFGLEETLLLARIRSDAEERRTDSAARPHSLAVERRLFLAELIKTAYTN
jgi:hypothetical protein